MKEVMDMDIKVIGAGCDKCGKLYTNTLDALSELGVEVPVEKVEGLREIVLLGVMSSPALMVDGKLLIAGRAAGKGEILDLLRPYLP